MASSGYNPLLDQSVVMDVAPAAAPQISDHPYETQCWGCGLRLILPHFCTVFKCGWCGAVTLNKAPKSKKWIKCAVFRDRLLVAVVFVLMLSITGGGLWSVYPVLFPRPSLIGYLQIFITAVLASITLLSYCSAAFVSAGSPEKIPHGSVQLVGKSALDGFTYCIYCCCPKPPQAHHCRTCGTCIIDMDHHCPFIGNCVGANNHKHFLLFLVYTTISSSYVLLMSVLAGLKVWKPILKLHSSRSTNPSGILEAAGTILTVSFLDAFDDQDEEISSNNLAFRSLALIYLLITAASTLMGLTLLLRQQLQLLYEGQTYVGSIQSADESLKPGWHNLHRLFGKRHPLVWLLPDFSAEGSYLKKLHSK